MTVLTDLNQCWSKLSYTDEHFTIVQHAPEAPVTDDAAAAAADLRTAAVVHIKYALGQSAARLKAILRQVSGGVHGDSCSSAPLKSEASC